MYDELAPNENASQYEDILKKGIKNRSYLDQIKHFFFLFMNQKDVLKSIIFYDPFS